MKIKTLLILASVIIFISSFTLISKIEEWKVPAAASKAKNPTDLKDAEGIATGKALYAKHCKSCHGTKGLGDGTKAGEIETPMPDFSKPATQGQTDGDLFYKTKEGRDDMPGFGKKITDDEEIWLLVNFMRGLKK
ncbi:MAG: hypothetical protein A3K10_11005 [Bacteroidetes bacterium RIFCSPLOWO2_12_FULL_31_6]|nr:MAG: hypothetical protein A3K10_11005 [Bacteroidetes bacterium RIFCSPLOWO2_12_FULL_31_6]